MNARLLLLVAAVVCLVIALLMATGAISSNSQESWFIGGLLAFVLSFFDLDAMMRELRK